MQRIRLLVASPFAPRLDVAHGGRAVAQLLYHLAGRHEVGLVCLRRPGSDPVDPALAERCALVREIEQAPRGEAAKRWLRRAQVLAAPFTGLPSRVAATRSRSFRHALAETARSFAPDVVQLEHEETAQYVDVLRGIRAARVLVAHDPGLAAVLSLASLTSGRQRLAHRLDAIGWRRFWRRSLPAFDAIVAFSERDALLLRRAAPGVRVLTIPLGTVLPERPLSATGRGTPAVALVGGYLHPPNADAALRLIRSIAPDARRRVGRLRLLLVGAGPTREMLAEAGPEDVVTGFVPDVNPFLDEAALVALPIRLGGGMRVKLLEALAAGKAVVATRVAAAGLDVADGRELLFAESDEEFVEAIVRLVENEQERVRLASAARAWAEENLGWESRVEAYEALYSSLLRERRTSGGDV